MSSYTNPYCKLLYIKEEIEKAKLLGKFPRDRDVVVDKLICEFSSVDTAMMLYDALALLNRIYKEIEDMPFEKEDLNLLVKIRIYVESFPDDWGIKAKYLKWFFTEPT